MFGLFFIDVRFKQEKKKRFPLVFICGVTITRYCKSFVPSHDLARQGLFWISAGLRNQMHKFVTGIPSSAKSFSNAASCFPLSSRSTQNSSSTSATSICSSQSHQYRLPDDLQEDVPSRPKLHVIRRINTMVPSTIY